MHTDKSIRVLLMEADRPIKILLERELAPRGPTVVAVESGARALDHLARHPVDVARFDFELPGVGRIETRSRHRAGGDASHVVLVESQPHKELAAPAGEDDDAEPGDAGEHSFLTRPLTSTDLDEIVREADDLGPASGSPPAHPAPSKSNRLLGSSAAMRRLLELAHRVAAGSASILLEGETGTGKSLLAQEIHAASPRAGEHLVAINCGAFQDQLLESELFGHERGAFTGALAAKPGLFEVAHRGTLFLDEVAEMTSAMQAKLLQVLDEGELRRVGGTKSRKVDVRIIAASNRNLEQEVRAKRFREDLYFRLKVIHLVVPPLRERSEDLGLLVEHFLHRFRLPGQPRKQIAPGTLQLFRAYSWPGNVRELANMIEGLVLLAPGDEITAEDLPPNLRPARKLELDSSETPLPMSEIERLHIIRTLRFTEGTKAPAARLLGIDVKTLNNKIRSYEIELPK